jgi:prepilin-type N-terminal cleavage/methylation domain-containing protein
MRKGFSLIEALAALVVIAAAFIGFAPLYKTLLTDIPRSRKLVGTNTSLLNMLARMHNDIDVATGLPQSFGAYSAGDEQLLIELADGVICYRFEEGKVIRRNLSDGPQGGANKAEVWSVPQGKVRWRLRREGDRGYAVEVSTHIEDEVGGRVKKRMAASHLYFLGALREVSR